MEEYSIRQYLTYHLDELHKNIIKKHILNETSITFENAPFFEFVHFLEQPENTKKYIPEYTLWKKDEKAINKDRKEKLKKLLISINFLKANLNKNCSNKNKTDLKNTIKRYECEFDSLYTQTFNTLK